MSILETRIKAMRYEMDRGRGGDRAWPFPVPLEPPFTPFQGNKPVISPARQVERPQPQIETPVSVDCLEFLRVRLSVDDEYGVGLAEQLLLALGSRSPTSFEVLGINGKVVLQYGALNEDCENVSRQLSSHYPRAQVSQEDDLLKQQRHHRFLARSYRLRESHLFRIRVQHGAENYAALMGILSGLGADQIALLQVLFQPVRNPWQENILRVACDPWDPSKSAFLDLPTLPKRAQAKIEKPLFAVAVRIAATRNDVLDRLEGSFFTQFESEENGLVPVVHTYPGDAILGRYTLTTGMLLNAQELSSLVHSPDPENLADGTVELATPTALAPQTAVNQLVFLGINRHQGKETTVGIGANRLTRHVAIFGATGYGKTTLLKRFAISLIEKDYGFAFLDPAGDAAEEFLELVPERRIEDVVYFNPGDREYPPALNVLQSSGQDQEMLTAELMVGLKRIFHGHSEFGPRMEWITRQAIRTLLASEGEKTLRDIPRLLADKSYLEEVLKTVNDPDLLWFWETRAPFPASVIDPVLNRLSAFLDRPTIRNIVSQPNLIDFDEIIQEGKILICNLSKGILGEEHSSLLGSFILSKLQLAALRRAELPPSDRKLFAIIVDEFQNYAGNGTDTASIRSFLSEARKYGVPLITVTQFTSQLDKDVLTAIFGNVGTMICFRCGMVDAQVLQRELGIFDADDLLNLETGQVLVRMGRAASAFNVDIIAPSPSTYSVKSQIVQLSRERYCRKRDEVELAMQETFQRSVPKTQPPPRELIEPDELAFLERAAHHPEDTVTTICSALDLSGSRAVRIRGLLVERDFLVEVDTRLGRKGRRAKYAIPTLKGYQILGEKPPKGRGGAIHKHFTEVIARWAVEKGYKVSKEHNIQKGWVDLHLERDGKETAVELSITSTVDRELNNMKKCLEAGYTKVVSLFLDESLLQVFSEFLSKKLVDEERKKVEVGSLNEFHRVL